MKAEHRKELQTNALADRMGRFIKQIKKRPSRGSFLTWVLVVIVLAAGGFFLLRRGAAANREARAWAEFSQGDYPRAREGKRTVYNYDILMQERSLVGRAAKLQRAWEFLHDRGIKMLQADYFNALDAVRAAGKVYESTFPEVKDDPVLAPEVKYALAVVEETLAAQLTLTDKKREEHIDKALRLYQGVEKEYRGSAHGEQAKKRVELLKTPEQRRRLIEFYGELSRRIFFSDMPGPPPIRFPQSPPPKK